MQICPMVETSVFVVCVREAEQPVLDTLQVSVREVQRRLRGAPVKDFGTTLSSRGSTSSTETCLYDQPPEDRPG